MYAFNRVGSTFYKDYRELPNWITDVIEISIPNIDVSKFCDARIHYHIVDPDKNTFCPEWAIELDLLITVKDRQNGDQINLSDGKKAYLYSNSDVEATIYYVLRDLLSHELRECYQVKQGKNSIILYDPHRDDLPSMSSEIRYSLYRKYPSLLSMLKYKIYLPFIEFLKSELYEYDNKC